VHRRSQQSSLAPAVRVQIARRRSISRFVDPQQQHPSMNSQSSSDLSDLSTMPALELACYFASWCLAGTFRSATQWWLDSAVSLAAGSSGDRSVPRARG
jgi:hypothetical protein